MNHETDFLIVGAGLAGLTCARALAAVGRTSVLLEAGDAPGGRVRTDRVDGFLLDRGFQVLLTAYPESRRWLDYPALALREFEPGARVWTGRRFSTVSDPWRRPWRAWETLRADVGSLSDKLRIAALRARCQSGTWETLFERPETTALERLREIGFGPALIERFFRPFFGGVFLERELTTSSRLLEFVFRMFSAGPIAVPAAGMQAIPEQLAAGLPTGCLRLNSPVRRLTATRGEVRAELVSGERWRARAAVVATDAESAARLLGGSFLAFDRFALFRRAARSSGRALADARRSGRGTGQPSGGDEPCLHPVRAYRPEPDRGQHRRRLPSGG